MKKVLLFLISLLVMAICLPAMLVGFIKRGWTVAYHTGQKNFDDLDDAIHHD